MKGVDKITDKKNNTLSTYVHTSLHTSDDTDTQKLNVDKQISNNKTIPIVCSRCNGTIKNCTLCKGTGIKKPENTSAFIELICNRCYGRAFDCIYCGGMPYQA